MIAAALTVLAPAALYQVSTLYVDVARVAVPVAAWQFLLAAFPHRTDSVDAVEGPGGPQVRNLILAGACLGLAAGIKPSNLPYCAAAFIVMVAFAARRTRRCTAAAERGKTGRAWEIPRIGRCTAALVIPAWVLGSFWYLLTWVRWKTPLWPVAMGPIPGRVSAADLTSVHGLQLPADWRGAGRWTLLVRSWLTDYPGSAQPAGDWLPYSMGPAWLAILLPAIVIAADPRGP